MWVVCPLYRRVGRAEEEVGGEHEGAEECADPPTLCNEREVVDDWPRTDSLRVMRARRVA